MIDGYMILDLQTAECEIGFSTVQQAQKYINDIDIPELTGQEYINPDFDLSENERVVIFPYIIQSTKSISAELNLYYNAYKNRPFGYVAEYADDLCNDDIICTKDTALIIQFIED